MCDGQPAARGRRRRGSGPHPTRHPCAWLHRAHTPRGAGLLASRVLSAVSGADELEPEKVVSTQLGVPQAGGQPPSWWLIPKLAAKVGTHRRAAGGGRPVSVLSVLSPFLFFLPPSRMRCSEGSLASAWSLFLRLSSRGRK